MPNITILGAGSTVFARQLITDILQIEGLDEGCFALVDIDATRLELAHQLAERLVTQSGKRWSVRASTECRDLLAGSDFIINSIEVAGLANVRHDFDIPTKYGINQCIGDTIGQEESSKHCARVPRGWIFYTMPSNYALKRAF